MSRSLPVLNNTGTSSSLRRDGRREFIVPADVSGRFTLRRTMLFAVLIAVYVLTPWIEVNGHPLVFLDIEHSAFYLFGSTFNAQDVWLVFFLLSGVGFTLIVITALWGRVWCGYACPQTVFLEGVYRRVERLIEGPRNVRLRRDAGAVAFSRVWRKLLKHAIFLVISAFIAHAFLSYFVSWPGLLRMVRGNPAEHPEAFAWASVMTAIFYGNFAWFREQLCLIVCPYGRLQSALTDSDTLVIGYDAKRGEPRGKAKAAGVGDCVDCGRCVVVCPTGIDIRNGLQLDCIGCAACVDACDQVMQRLERPEGLIRYDSLNGFAGQKRKFVRPRLYLYMALGALGCLVAGLSVRLREPFEANLLRLQGAPFVLEEGGTRVRNAFELHLVNKQARAVKFVLRPAGGTDLDYVFASPELMLEPLAARRIPVFASAPNDRRTRRVVIEVSDGEKTRRIEGALVAPR